MKRCRTSMPRPRRRLAFAPLLVLALLLLPTTIEAGTAGALPPPSAGPAALPAPGPGAPPGSVPAPNPPPVGPSPVDNWTGPLPGPAPSPREAAEMAFDPLLNETVLFGGTTTAPDQGDTYAFTASGWHVLATTGPGPAPRWGGGFCFDGTLGELVLFGGRNATQLFGDTWAFNGSAWTELAPAAAPSPRWGLSMTYNSRSGNLILYGGLVETLQPTPGPVVALNDTWQFDGVDWTNDTAAAGFGPVGPGSLVYDPADRYSVLVGGEAPRNHVWVLSRGLWRELYTGPASTPPAADLVGTAVWDTEAEGVLVFGGYLNGSVSNATWIYRSGGWTNLTSQLPYAPAARANESLADDPNASGVLLFGGNVPALAGGEANDSWWFRGVPFASRVSSAPAATDAGHPVTISDAILEATGAGFAYTFNYSGLPSACSSANASSIPCTSDVPGSYTVTSTVTRSDLTVVNASTVLTVNPPPDALAHASVASGDVGLPVSFNVTVENGTAPFNETWDFGDGHMAWGADVTHSYARLGFFQVNVTVVDASGVVAGSTLGLGIDPTFAAVASENRTTTDVGVPVGFSANLSGGTSPENTTWSFGDGSPNTTTGPSVSHTFTTAGQFNVTLLAVDAAGARVLAPLTVVVAPDPEVRIAIAPAVVDVGHAARIWANTSFGAGGGLFSLQLNETVANRSVAQQTLDGLPAGALPASVNFTTAGEVAVEVRYVDAAHGVAVAQGLYTVAAGPSATVQPSANVTDVGLPVQFGSAVFDGIGPYVESWAFSDGGTALGPEANHSFALAGHDWARLTVTDEQGATTTDTSNVTVAPYPVAVIVIASLTGCGSSAEATFQARVAGGTPGYSYAWTLLDGGTPSSRSANASQGFPNGSGTYPVVLHGVDAAGATFSASTSLAVPTCPATGLDAPLAGLPGWAWLVAALLVVVLAVAALWLWRGRRPPPSPVPAASAAPPPAPAPVPEWMEPEEPTSPPRGPGG